MSGGVPNLTNKRVLVVGLGRSGIAAAKLCAARGARVTVTDKRDERAFGGALGALPVDITRELGGHRLATFTAAELIVLSPGVPDIPELVAARAAGVTVTGEMELASRFVSSTLIAITGTNGKSTTTTLIVAASGSASSAPTKPPRDAPMSVATITDAGDRSTAPFMTRGTST